MIDLSRTSSVSPLIHTVTTDPGTRWTKETKVAIDAPPDDDINPRPEAQWQPQAVRTGVCGAVSPRVIALPSGGYRLYYTQILPRPGFPAGANDYDNATTRILSAISPDGSVWTPEPGVRLSPAEGGAGEFRVVSSEVAPMLDGTERMRMYYESCSGPQSTQNSIRSAVSEDGGLKWTPEAGARFETSGRNYSSPRIIFLNDGRCRLYCYERGLGIISAVSDDGLVFHREPGLRIAEDGTYDSHVAFAPDILRVENAGYVMYYAGYSAANRSYILRAESVDGLIWRKQNEPVISPEPGAWDAAKCSEVCVFRLPERPGKTPRFGMVYEACDGTAENERGVWRIASAVTESEDC
jgi:hypothetical protein